MKWFYLLFTFSILSCQAQTSALPNQKKSMENNSKTDKVVKTDAEWKQILDPEAFRVLRQSGTEYPGTGKYNLMDEPGKYYCKGCNTYLFSSDQKFGSSCGWPSFYDVQEGAIDYITDNTLGMSRVEVRCAKCGGHLGHVFEDGPRDKTGKRYCINSAALNFVPIKK
jgi:peptide-methionine (R)-S-oxide reductase